MAIIFTKIILDKVCLLCDIDKLKKMCYTIRVEQSNYTFAGTRASQIVELPHHLNGVSGNRSVQRQGTPQASCRWDAGGIYGISACLLNESRNRRCSTKKMCGAQESYSGFARKQEPLPVASNAV